MKKNCYLFIFNRKPLSAEGHDVLYFSEQPIVQIVMGAKGSVWIVRESPNDLGDHCSRIINLFTSPSYQYVLR